MKVKVGTRVRVRIRVRVRVSGNKLFCRTLGRNVRGYSCLVALLTSEPYLRVCTCLRYPYSKYPPYFVHVISRVRYLELTDFWLSSFGTKQVVSVEAFCSALEAHFKDGESTSFRLNSCASDRVDR